MAAVLACGNGAVLSHRSAAALWKITQPIQMIDVTVASSGGRKGHRGIELHRSRTLVPSDCTLRNAIPMTAPARTLDDLRRVLSAKEFAAAVREAEFLRLPVGERFAPDRTRSAFETDRARDAQLKVLGYEVLRFTWRRITSEPGGVARTIRALLKSPRRRC